jgi:hypothetical protein
VRVALAVEDKGLREDIFPHPCSRQLLGLNSHEVLGLSEANAEAIGIAILRGLHLGAIEGITAMTELHRRQACGIHPPQLPTILVHDGIVVFIDPAVRVIEPDLLLDALVVPHHFEHVAGKLLAEVLDQLSVPYLGQIEIGGSLHVQVGRAAMQFIEHAEINLAIPGAKLFLNVEDD